MASAMSLAPMVTNPADSALEVKIKCVDVSTKRTLRSIDASSGETYRWPFFLAPQLVLWFSRRETESRQRDELAGARMELADRFRARQL